MKTFELYGDVYPSDSKYARLMAQYMVTPNYDRNSKKEWELYRDIAIKKRMSEKDMKAFMVAKDSAHHNMILGRPPRTEGDMEELYSRQFRVASSRVAEDECSGKTDTMDYVKCRATKMEKEQGTPADKAFPTAWSIACKYKRDQLSDADEHCQKKPNEYFKSKKANGDPMNRKANRGLLQLMIETILPALYRWRTTQLSRDLKRDLTDLALGDQMEELVVLNNYDELIGLMDNEEAMQWLQLDPQTYKKAVMAMFINGRKMRLASEDIMAGHTQESFKKMMKENPELEEEWKKQIEENRGVVSSLEDKWASLSAEEAEYTELMAGHTPESFKKMYDGMSEEDKKKWEANKDKYGDKFKKAHDKTARLMKRQIKILEKYVASAYDVPLFFDDLPSNVIAQLRRVKDQETLHTDVERWLGDWKMEQRMNSRWANTTLTTRSAKENPMNKTARVALRTLTANWGLTANEAYEMLAEEELADYLAEMEADMWAEEMEAGGNTSFDVYKPMSQPGAFKPNTTNEMRGGQGAGGKGNKNYLYHDYGKANSYAPDYYQRYYKRKKKKPEGIKRRNCPDMKGGKFPCTKTKEEKKKSR